MTAPATGYTDVTYPSHCGRLTLYARDYGPGSTGMTVLCMHGLTRNSADFHDLALHLSPRYRVISVDQRGRGRSDWDPDPARYTPAEYVQDMITLLDHLEIGDVALIGTSMGGLMSMIMGAMIPDRIRGMVLNDIGPEVAEEGLDRIRGYVGAMPPARTWDEAREQVEATNGPFFPDYGPEDWNAFARRTYREDETGRPVLDYDPAIARGLAPPEGPDTPETTPDATPDLWPMWDTLGAIPALVIRGDMSDILSPETMAEMVERHPRLEAVTVPNRGHAPMLDEPVAVEAIDRFLKGLAQG